MANILKKVLHNTSSKSPQDLVSRTSAAADKLTETASERQQEELSKYLTYMKVRFLPIHACFSALFQVWSSAQSQSCRPCQGAEAVNHHRPTSVLSFVFLPITLDNRKSECQYFPHNDCHPGIQPDPAQPADSKALLVLMAYQTSAGSHVWGRRG